MRGFANPSDWPAQYPVTSLDAPVELSLPDAPSLKFMDKVTTTCLIRHSKVGELIVKVFLGMPGSPQVQRVSELVSTLTRNPDVSTSYCFAGVLGLPVHGSPNRLPGMFTGLRTGLCVPMRFCPRADAYMLIETDGDDGLFPKCSVEIHPLTKQFVQAAQREKHKIINAAKAANAGVGKTPKTGVS